MKLDRRSFSMVVVIIAASCTATSYMNYGFSSKTLIATIVSVLISVPIVYLILLGANKLKHLTK